MGTPILHVARTVQRHRRRISAPTSTRFVAVLFRLLTGRPPFAIHGGGPVIAAHLTEPPRRRVDSTHNCRRGWMRSCFGASRRRARIDFLRWPTSVTSAIACSRHWQPVAGRCRGNGRRRRFPDAQPTTLAAWPARSHDRRLPRTAGGSVPRSRSCVLAASVAVVAVAWNGDDVRATRPHPAVSSRARRVAAPPIDAPAPTALAVDAPPVSAEPPAEAAKPAGRRAGHREAAGRKPPT